MSYAERHIVDVQTDADGNAIEYTPTVSGRIINVIYTKPGSSPYSAGVDFTITLNKTGQNVWTEDSVDASKTVAPRQPTHDTAGAALLYLTGEEPVEDYIVAAKDRIKIAIANGGDTLDGQFIIIMG